MFGSPLSETSQTRLSNLDDFPKIVETQLGKYIAALDKDEEYFKVFIFPTHAEVWHITSWKTSMSKHLLRQKESEQARFDSGKETILKDGIIRVFISRGVRINQDVVAYVDLLVELQDELLFKQRGIDWLLKQWKEIANPHKLPAWWCKPPEEAPEGPDQTNYAPWSEQP